MSKNWSQTVLAKYEKDIMRSALFSLVFVLTATLWRFGLGREFHWESIEPIEAPSLFIRSFYSALVFLTSGALLYAIGFYLHLHTFCVKILGDWNLYRGIKAAVWLLLILLTCWGVGKATMILNNVVSFFYNLFNLTLYLIPPVGVALVIIAITMLIRRLKLE